MTKESRIAKLNAVAEEKKQDCLNRTEKAISQLLKNNERISFGSVARVAGVSASYLYKYPEIKERIQDLREQQKRGAKKPTVAQTASEKSKATIINQFRERIKRLEDEKNELRQVNERLTGKLYQYQGIEEQAERFRVENAELKQQLDECRRRHLKPISTDDLKVSSLSEKRKQKTDISDRIKIELDALGIRLNSTLSKKIRFVSEEMVLAAIEALKQAMKEGEVRSPGGWLARAIEDGWRKNEPQPQQTSLLKPTIYTAPEEFGEELITPEEIQELWKGLN